MPLLCPGCGVVQTEDAVICDACRLPLEWIGGFPAFRDSLRNSAADIGVSNVAMAFPAMQVTNQNISLSRTSLTTLGRASENTCSLPDPTVEPQHAMIAPFSGLMKRVAGQVFNVPLLEDAFQKTAEAIHAEPVAVPRFFLVDRRTRIGTYVNRRRVVAVELQAGDLIQIGPFAWSFSAVDGHLVPINPIAGVGLRLSGLCVKGRLGPDFELAIQPGQFVALVGGSGAGKSTLVKVLAGQPGLIAAGQVDVLELDGSRWPREENSERFRDALGYVSQDSILHESLSARQILATSARLRGEPSDGATVELALMRAEIERERWDQPIRTLSGGQNKRIRTASELMGRPRLLLLDEPDSGLDRDRRASLLRLLRVLSWQGCTVVLVTHVIGDLEHHCDRVVEIRKGMIVRDNCTTGSNEPIESAIGTGLLSITPATMSNGQFGILVGREVALLQADFWSRMTVPAIVATLFAVAVGVAIESTHVPLLGYLSIVSVLWMSASSSLLAIVGEREVFEHERQLVLSVRHYLAAKFMVAAAVAASQTLLFLGALWSVRYVLDRALFKSPIWAVAILIATSVVGVSLGLCLSALAGRKKETATFLLPLVMISQLVFSVPVAYPDAARDSVESAYTKFHPAETNVRLAASISMLTITRPADIALRAMSYDEADERATEHAAYAVWGAAALGCWMVALLIITLMQLLWGIVYSSVCKRIRGLRFAGR